jgi:branched-chain amino acid transport system ATP-binding protein
MVLEGVTKRFGSLTVLSDVTFDIRAGEILGIAGPNGAGKSTLLNVCTGLLRPDKGCIRFGNARTDRYPPHRLCHLGVARTFQIPQVFGSLTIAENIDTGGLFGAEQTRRTRRTSVEQILQQLGLADRRNALAGSVDLFTRKMVMLGAALATNPRLLFMDEPFGGLNADEIDAYADLVLTLRQDRDLSFVIVEHKIRALARLSSRLLILDFGSVLCLGAVQEVLADKQVIETYLGAFGLAAG